MGEAFDGLGRSADAITEFKLAEKISPTEPRVHFGLEYLLWKSREFDEAQEEFEREVSANFNNAQAWAYLGDIA